MSRTMQSCSPTSMDLRGGMGPSVASARVRGHRLVCAPMVHRQERWEERCSKESASHSPRLSHKKDDLITHISSYPSMNFHAMRASTRAKRRVA